MDLALAVSSAAFITLLVLWFLKPSSNLPPGPWGLPLIGHLHLLAGMPLHRAFQRIAKKYGPITSLRLGMIPTVVISNQELAKEIFTTHDLNFASRPYLVSGDHFSYNFSGPATSPYGELWRNTRKLCTIELFTAKCIDSFSWVRRDELSRTLEGILKDHGDDEPVEVRKVASVFSFNITSRILMSKRYFGDENVDAHAMEFKELNDKVLELVINPCISNLVPWYLRWLDWQIPRYKRIRTTLLVNAWAIGMDPAVWENPTQFHPERFLGSSIDVKGHNFELLPFGSGRRKCPGMGMGLRSVELLVANLIHGFNWSFVPGTTPSMEDVFSTTAQLKTPLQAMATPRLPKEVYIKV
ncbi:flavonoid 3'-monooxygenase [Selaginella moellendorffii]|uniref:flavonoid 3'-monooxygenase n=1 Tax=Selaginella moellendorffii TaxID=88036 RepID=UPI000D1C6C07|nr:flavonoid 3'-monooxygenase [Selaginella moellendorffii]|eukprot:XP_002994780.2 flavonoid 3'-monooxygenase [Selaginella moellendorffii]